MAKPFHRLLAFYTRFNPPKVPSQTLPFSSSLRGNLSLGLDFPAALLTALLRHLAFRNTGFLSLSIHIPSVKTEKTPLDGVDFEERREYTCGEVVKMAWNRNGALAALDAAGVWSLGADVGTGKVRGGDLVEFQHGTLLDKLEKRRKDRSQVLPLWRGGPISVTGHSWAVNKVFGVEVYRKEKI